MRPNNSLTFQKHILVYGFSPEEWEEVLSDIELEILKLKENVVIIRSQLINDPEFLEKIIKDPVSEVYIVVDELGKFVIRDDYLANNKVHIIAWTKEINENTKTLLENDAEVVVLPSVTRVPEEFRGRVNDKLGIKLRVINAQVQVF